MLTQLCCIHLQPPKSIVDAGSMATDPTRVSPPGVGGHGVLRPMGSGERPGSCGSICWPGPAGSREGILEDFPGPVDLAELGTPWGPEADTSEPRAGGTCITRSDPLPGQPAAGWPVVSSPWFLAKDEEVQMARVECDSVLGLAWLPGPQRGLLGFGKEPVRRWPPTRGPGGLSFPQWLVSAAWAQLWARGATGVAW